MEVQMHWLDPATESAKEEETPATPRRGPPRLPGLPEIPPMPVAASEVPAIPTNKTIEVDPGWLELVEERRAKNKQNAAAAPAPAPAPAAPTKKEPPPAEAQRPRPRVRPIIPREDE